MSGDELLSEARKLEKNLLNLFWRRGVSNYEGEDLLQETYLRLWNYRNEYKEDAKPSTFIFMVAIQVCMDAHRSKTRRERREEIWQQSRPLKQHDKAAMLHEDVRWALSQLPPPMRDVVELGVFQDLPYAEISQALSIPVGTVKSRMFNALKRLKELFDNDEGSGRNS